MSCLDLRVSRFEDRVRGSSTCLSISPRWARSRCLSGPRQPTTADHRQRAEGSRPALHSNTARSAAPSSCASGESLGTMKTWSVTQHMSTTTSLVRDAKNISVQISLSSSSPSIDSWRMWRCSSLGTRKGPTRHAPLPHQTVFHRQTLDFSRHESSFACECHDCI
jgi:hypothetical protein